MDESTEKKVGRVIGIVMIVTWILASIYFGLYTGIYWWTHDSLTLIQVFKTAIHNRPIIFWYIVIMTIISQIAQIKKTY